MKFESLRYTADFETITEYEKDNKGNFILKEDSNGELRKVPKRCRVWAWAISGIDEEGFFHYDNNLDSFMEECKYMNNATIYFHNLKFDCSYILDWLFKHNFKHCIDIKECKDKTFTTLISDKGQFFSLTVYFKKKGKKVMKVTFLDSLKILPFKVAKIAEDFNLDIRKGDIDYKAWREEGHMITDEELSYLRNDVEIMSQALRIMFNQGMNRMTSASNALHDYKKIMGDKFEKYFPILELYIDEYIRNSYKGGFTYVNPKFQNRVIGNGMVFDVNSLYPSVMYNKLLPYGYPMKFKGKYKPDKNYPLYVQKFSCMFELKKDHLPTLQIKQDTRFVGTEYLESSNGEEVVLTMTSIDMKLFFEHYDVYNPTFIDGYKFRGTKGLFTKYIDKWSAEKIKAKEDGNSSMYLLSKLMLNSLYGKFALNPHIRSKIPFYNKLKKKVQFKLGDEEIRDGIYLPVGAFITSYAREITITAAQSQFDRFMYADTDSIHLEGMEMPTNIEVHPTKLGAWDYEGKFDEAYYIRQKTYIEHLSKPTKEEYKWKITCAGMPEACYKNVTFDNFRIGSTYEGKLITKRIDGGISLEDSTFKIKMI